MEILNQWLIQVLSTSLLVLLAIEMFARVAISTWFEIWSLLKTERHNQHE